ncbi:MAG: CGNR zinc finger domain-containing protein [Bacillota bacterium]
MESLCLDFVNTKWYNTHSLFREPLGDPTWLKGFLAKWSLEVPDSPGSADLASLLHLRTFLEGLLARVAQGQALTQEDLGALNAYLSLCRLGRVFSGKTGNERVVLVPFEKDWDWVLSEIAASCANLLAQRERSRIKICENPDCKWVFYDESRSRNRRWCDKTCGNLLKVRRFRARKRQSGG